jgi:uncharacterized protein (UPF0335 family)
MSANAELQSFIDRLASLLKEKSETESLIADLKQEIASAGFDKSAVDAVVKRVMMDHEKAVKAKAKEEAIKTYVLALGQSDLFGF